MPNRIKEWTLDTVDEIYEARAKADLPTSSSPPDQDWFALAHVLYTIGIGNDLAELARDAANSLRANYERFEDDIVDHNKAQLGYPFSNDLFRDIALRYRDRSPIGTLPIEDTLGALPDELLFPPRSMKVALSKDRHFPHVDLSRARLRWRLDGWQPRFPTRLDKLPPERLMEILDKEIIPGLHLSINQSYYTVGYDISNRIIDIRSRFQALDSPHRNRGDHSRGQILEDGDIDRQLDRARAQIIMHRWWHEHLKTILETRDDLRELQRSMSSQGHENDFRDTVSHQLTPLLRRASDVAVRVMPALVESTNQAEADQALFEIPGSKTREELLASFTSSDFETPPSTLSRQALSDYLDRLDLS